ncbi:MAG: hypothetical protein U5Q03_17505 [Bacteroidota bacterium]|nr:hypothetical protein [Bacteroidota bacterium]
MYHSFEIRKKNGTRPIEEPEERLKRLLKTLNNYLQATYYYMKSDAAYGFVLSSSKNSPFS